MRKIYSFMFLLFPLFVACTAGSKEVTNAPITVIPKPVKLEKSSSGNFILNQNTTFNYDGENAELQKIGEMLSKRMESALGYTISKGASKSELFFVITADSSKNQESYSLDVTPKRITIEAPSAAGIYYGTQTLFQLLPPQIKSRTAITDTPWIISSVQIEDTPRMAWRGTMMDVSRHFFTKEQVFNVIDQITEYKINHLHMHLSDDQGWRIEIKSMPELTQKTAYRPSRIGDWWKMDPATADEKFDYGGFYTQEEMKEIIAYAKERYVEIVPEIDVPGHSLALMVAHPDLHCFKTFDIVNIGNEQDWEKSSLCIGNKKLMPVMETIFKEIAELFPSNYIHIGGDECGKLLWKKCPKCQALIKSQGLKDEYELQSYFIKNMVQYVSSLGKTAIGWDEIMEGGLAPDAVVMSWTGMEAGKEAARSGHRVIMTPNEHCYVDLYKGDPAIETRTYGKCRLFDSYNWNPVPDSISSELILGGQANLWSETLTTVRQFEYCLYPNLWALAETFWTPQEQREWSEFFPRMESHFTRADYADINYAKSVYNAWVRPYTSLEDGKVYIDIEKELDDVSIYYTLDNTIPDHHSALYDGKPFTLPRNSSKINIQTYRNGSPCGKLFRVTTEEINQRATRVKK